MTEPHLPTPNPEHRLLVYVDTDVGLGTSYAEIDDGAALILLARHPAVQLVGAGAVFGNVGLQDALINLDRLLAWLDVDSIPLGSGASGPITADIAWFREWQSHYGHTLPWQLRQAPVDAARMLIRLIYQQPGRITILALGPLTTLALAARLDPNIIPLTHKVIAMGGSFNAEKPAPEFNIRCDPEAAREVFNAGWDITLLGLEITRQVHFSRQDFASLPTRDPAVDLLRSQAPGWIDRMEAMGWERDGCALHDAVAAACLIDDSLFTTQETGVCVALSSSSSPGLTRFLPAAPGQPSIKVVTSVDAVKCHDLIWSCISEEKQP